MFFLLFAFFLASCHGIDPNAYLVQHDAIGVGPEDEMFHKVSFVDGAVTFINGTIAPYAGKLINVISPVYNLSSHQPMVLGRLADMTEADLSPILAAAAEAWGTGQGVWPQMTFLERIHAMEASVAMIKARRAEMVDILTWEIAKSIPDAAQEFDRTLTYISASVDMLKTMDQDWISTEGILSRTRRAAVGIMLCVGPANYPLNEVYAALIPALLMGNVAILKLPSVGGLVHIFTMEAFRSLPPGVLQFVTGSGRKLLPPIMKTGLVDILSFIGGSHAADTLLRAHPNPHRLKTFLQLEGKNLAVITPSAVDVLDQLIVGALSYNGQRCTALKLIVVHSSKVKEVLEGLVEKVQGLPYGLPWMDYKGPVLITPLPAERIAYMNALLTDAVTKGARIVNNDAFLDIPWGLQGGHTHGKLMRPAVVYPVNKDMKLFHEEQFGPIVPVMSYEEPSEVLDILRSSPYGQQVSLFCHNATSLGKYVDAFSTAVGRININTQCGRSPDSLPFSGRRSSAQGTMSISEALKTFSIETVIAGKEGIKGNKKVMQELDQTSRFLSSMHGDGTRGNGDL